MDSPNCTTTNNAGQYVLLQPVRWSRLDPARGTTSQAPVTRSMFKLLFQVIASFLQKWGILKTKTTDEDVEEFLAAHSKKETPEP